MKFALLGYADEKQWIGMTDAERRALIEECMAFDDLLRRGEHSTGVGDALAGSRAARTMRSKDGKLTVTDGPYAETKEQLGGFGMIEARDMEHAVELLSNHAGLRLGPTEIRPVDAEVTGRCQPNAEGTEAPAGPRFLCLGYFNESAWAAMSGSEREAMVDDCMAYEAVLKRYGQSLGGVALQDARTAKTLRLKGNKVAVIDGPYAETKELLGGIAINRFKDIDVAIEAWSQHPCLALGDVLEIRPANEEFHARVTAREGLLRR